MLQLYPFAVVLDWWVLPCATASDIPIDRNSQMAEICLLLKQTFPTRPSDSLANCISDFSCATTVQLDSQTKTAQNLDPRGTYDFNICNFQDSYEKLCRIRVNLQWVYVMALLMYGWLCGDITASGNKPSAVQLRYAFGLILSVMFYHCTSMGERSRAPSLTLKKKHY